MTQVDQYLWPKHLFFTQSVPQAEVTYQIVDEHPTETNEQGNSRKKFKVAIITASSVFVMEIVSLLVFSLVPCSPTNLSSLLKYLKFYLVLHEKNFVLMLTGNFIGHF